MKYWRLKFRGERSVDEVQSAVGQSGGNIVRMHSEGGETHVYIAAESIETPETARTMMATTTPEEVSADEVTQLS